MSLVVGQQYKTIDGEYLGRFLQHKTIAFTTGGPECAYVFENKQILDKDIYDRSNDLQKLNIEVVGGGKMISHKARRKRRRTLKQYKKTKLRK